VSVSDLLSTLNRRSVRFLIVGGLNTALGLGVFPLLYLLFVPLRPHYFQLLFISWTICVTFSFFTMKYLVFQSSGDSWQQYARFVSFHLATLLLNVGALPLILANSSLNPVRAQFLFSVTVVLLSYFWNSRVTFVSSRGL
jgi:putative flippase GtrA